MTGIYVWIYLARVYTLMRGFSLLNVELTVIITDVTNFQSTCTGTPLQNLICFHSARFTVKLNWQLKIFCMGMKRQNTGTQKLKP